MAIDHKTITDSEKHTPKGYPDTGSPGTNHVYQYSGSALEFGLVDTGNIASSAVTTAKLDNGSVTNDKVATGTLGAEKFQTGAAEDAWVSARIGSKTVTASNTVRWVAPALQGVYNGVLNTNKIFDVPQDTQFVGTSVIITASGSVRSVLALSVTNGAYIQILKNGVAEAVNNYSSSTGNNETWTVDVSVSVGDVLQIAVSTGDNNNTARGTSWTLGGDAECTV